MTMTFNENEEKNTTISWHVQEQIVSKTICIETKHNKR